MTDGKRTKGTPRSVVEPLRPRGTVSHGYLRDYLHGTEEMIRNLKKDLKYHREQSDAVVRERDDLARLSSQADLLQSERDQLGGELGMAVEERDRLEQFVGRLQLENQDLSARCVALEAALTNAQKKQGEALDVITYLEAQIEQLESMVKMLREHNRFMQD